jgi:hypothetical protein
VPEGERIAVDWWGPPLRYSAEGAELLASLDKLVNRQQKREASGQAPRTADRPPYTVIPLEHFYRYQSVWPHQWWECAPDAAIGDPKEKSIERFLDEMGVRWLVTTEKFPSDPRNCALDEVLARRGTKVAELLPWPEGAARPFEAKLPMDPRDGVLAVWGVNRSGPALALWKVE